MMEIQCSSCSKRYRIDETRIPGTTALVRCKSCGDTIRVEKATAKPPEPLPAEPPPAAVPDDTPIAGKPTPPPKEEVRGAVVSQGPTRVTFGLTAKLILIMLIVSLLPLGLYAWISFKQTEETSQSETAALMSQTADGLGSQVEEWIDKNVRVLKTAAAMPDIVSMDPLRQERILKTVAAEYPWMYLVFTLNPEGLNVARSDDKPLLDYSDRQYYKDVLSGKELAWQTLIGKTSKEPALVLAVPIKYGDRFFGVMAAAMTIEDISKQVAKWRKGKTGFAFLVDEKGKVVSHQDKNYVQEQKQLGDHPLIALFNRDKKDATLEFINDNGKPSIGRVKGINYGWALAIQQEKSEVLAGLRQSQQFAIILLAATVVLVTLVAWLSARAVVTPIKKLTDVAERMSLGDLNAEIDIRSKDEVGLLAQAIGRMQVSLRMAMQRLRARR